MTRTPTSSDTSQSETAPAHAEAGAVLPDSGEGVEWRVHLARTEPRKAAVVLGAAVAAAALCFLLFMNWAFALFSALVLVAGTAEFLFPIRYRLTPEAAEMHNLHNWRRIEWTEVKKAYLLDDGVKLSPLEVPTRLEPFRGVFLRFGEGPGERDRVLAAVRRYRDAVRRDPD